MEREQKLLHFKYFFVGRNDIYAIRQPRGDYRFRRQPLTDELLIGHMQGRHLLGSYPLQLNGTTRWVAADFDNKNGNAFEHAQVLVDTLRKFDIEPLCNTSQSGKGVHVRLIFSGSRRDVAMGHDVQASVARRFMLAMVEYSEIPKLSDGGAFDRVFPTQDVLLDERSVGNQIAMPLNKFAADDRGGTVLLDREFNKIPLGEATWEKLELYDLINTGTIFDAVQSIGRYSSVYGNADEHGRVIYDTDAGNETIYVKNTERRKKNSSYAATDFAFVLENCNFMKGVRRGGLPYAIWVDLASILAVFDDVGGRQKFHDISSLDSGTSDRGKNRYSAADTDAKYSNILTNYRSPVTCEHIAGDGWVCPHLGGDGICKKFRLSDGRGPRTPATVHFFRGDRDRAQVVG